MPALALPCTVERNGDTYYMTGLIKPEEKEEEDITIPPFLLFLKKKMTNKKIDPHKFLWIFNNSNPPTERQLEKLKQSLEKEVFAVRQKRDAINVQLQLLADETKEKDETLAMVDAAEAKLKQMSVAESEAELRLQRMTIRAPVDGRVYRLVGLPGARVGSGVMTAMTGHDGSSVITMYRPESLQIRVDVRFEDIPKVSLGQLVAISNPAMRDAIRGRVLFISSEADIQKNTLQVKVAIDDPPGFFKPEMLVDVTFLSPKQGENQDASKQELTLLILENLIFNEGGTSFVWVANQTTGVAEKTEVELGKRGNDGMVEILSGLDIGSRLISRGGDDLLDGQRVRVTGESASD